MSRAINVLAARYDGVLRICNEGELSILEVLDYGSGLVDFVGNGSAGTLDPDVSGDSVSGILVDCDSRTTAYWGSCSGIPGEYFQQFWEGWRLVDLVEDYESFAGLLDGRVRYRDSFTLEEGMGYVRSLFVPHWLDEVDDADVEACSRMSEEFLASPYAERWRR